MFCPNCGETTHLMVVDGSFSNNHNDIRCRLCNVRFQISNPSYLKPTARAGVAKSLNQLAVNIGKSESKRRHKASARSQGILFFEVASSTPIDSLASYVERSLSRSGR